MNNKQLTAADRGAIETLLNKKYNLSEIADAIGFHKSTISREINRRCTPNGYRALVAQLNYERNRKQFKQRKKLASSQT